MPPVVLERPKMTKILWESLKSHILRERQRKKQELEANAEEVRQKKERERQQKQDSMTLSETRDQIAKLDIHLTELKAEKHLLFEQLKKVFSEDEARRRILQTKEANEMINYHKEREREREREISLQQQQQSHQQSTKHGQIFMQPMQSIARPPLYKTVAMPQLMQQQTHSQPTLLPQVQGGMKRSRSPSPPPHNYRFGPFKPPPHAVHSYPHKPPIGIQYFSNSQQQQQQQQHQQSQSAPPPHQPHSSMTYQPQHHSQQQQQQSSSQQQQQGQGQLQGQGQGQPPALYSYQSAGGHGGRPVSTRSPQQMREDPQKHQQQQQQQSSHGSIYMQQQQPRGYVLHHQMEPKYVDENPKYYPPPSHQGSMNMMRSSGHINIHPGLTIQQQQGGQSGGITSGYPIRTTPSVSSYQGRPPSPHVIYAQSGPPRLSYNHQHGPPSSSPHGQHQTVTVARYSLPPGMTRDRDRDRD